MQNAILPWRTAPAGDPSPALTVRKFVGPDGYLELLAVERLGAGPEHAWSRFASDGSRAILFAAGRFRIGHWQSHEERLASMMASRPPEWRHVHLCPEARETLARSRAWKARDAEALASFAATCGTGTFAIACSGMDPAFLDAWDGPYGRDVVERAVTRLPALAEAMRMADASRHDARLLGACDRLLTGEPSITETCAALLPFLIRRFALLRDELPFIPDAMAPDSPPDKSMPRIGLAVRRMAAVPAHPADALLALTLCHLAPRDWAPATPDGIEAMARVMRLTLSLGTMLETLDIRTLLSSVEGDWASAWRALADAGATEPGDFAKGVADMCEAYDKQLLRPAAARVGWSAGTTVELPEDAAVRTLFSGKGLVTVARASRKWHRYAPYINTVVADLAGIQAQSWPRPCQDFVASNGLVLVPLMSVRELVEEGAAQGHCVGSYGQRVAAGGAAILSVRDPGGGRRSTVLVQGRRATEHKGRRNSDPSLDDRLAVSEFVRSLPEEGIARRQRPGVGTGWLEWGRRTLARLAAPDWAGKYAYDPHGPLNLEKVAGAWGGLVPRRSRGPAQALLAGTCRPGLHGATRDGTPAVKARPVRKAIATAEWSVENLVRGMPFGLWVLITGTGTILALYMILNSDEHRAFEARMEKAATEHAQRLDARAHALCGDRAPFLKTCPLNTPLPLPPPLVVKDR